MFSLQSRPAANIQMPSERNHPELARLVTQALAGVSSRDAMLKSGVSHSTIAGMKRGIRGSAESTIALAKAYGIDVNELLRASGHPEIQTEYGIPPELAVLIEQYNDLESDARPKAIEGMSDVIESLRRQSGRDAIGNNYEGRYTDKQKEQDRRIKTLTAEDFADDAD